MRITIFIFFSYTLTLLSFCFSILFFSDQAALSSILQVNGGAHKAKINPKEKPSGLRWSLSLGIIEETRT